MEACMVRGHLTGPGSFSNGALRGWRRNEDGSEGASLGISNTRLGPTQSQGCLHPFSSPGLPGAQRTLEDQNESGPELNSKFCLGPQFLSPCG